MAVARGKDARGMGKMGEEEMEIQLSSYGMNVMEIKGTGQRIWSMIL